jgi:hypothetical protein
MSFLSGFSGKGSSFDDQSQEGGDQRHAPEGHFGAIILSPRVTGHRRQGELRKKDVKF